MEFFSWCKRQNRPFKLLLFSCVGYFVVILYLLYEVIYKSNLQLIITLFIFFIALLLISGFIGSLYFDGTALDRSAKKDKKETITQLKRSNRSR